jgi:hypothetical protein
MADQQILELIKQQLFDRWNLFRVALPLVEQRNYVELRQHHPHLRKNLLQSIG